MQEGNGREVTFVGINQKFEDEKIISQIIRFSKGCVQNVDRVS